MDEVLNSLFNFYFWNWLFHSERTKVATVFKVLLYAVFYSPLAFVTLSITKLVRVIRVLCMFWYLLTSGPLY